MWQVTARRRRQPLLRAVWLPTLASQVHDKFKVGLVKSFLIVVSIRVGKKGTACEWVVELFPIPAWARNNSAVVLSAIKSISATHFPPLLQTMQHVFLVPNGQFLPYVLRCLNSRGSKTISVYVSMCICACTTSISVCSYAKSLNFLFFCNISPISISLHFLHAHACTHTHTCLDILPLSSPPRIYLVLGQGQS